MIQENPPLKVSSSGSKRHLTLGVVVLLGAWCLATGVSQASAQTETSSEPRANSDPWAPFRLLGGTWEGTIDGRLGEGPTRQPPLTWSHDAAWARYADPVSARERTLVVLSRTFGCMSLSSVS